jgi:FKBP-type peptidyl-prolyl cis-trans isomerase FkpA
MKTKLFTLGAIATFFIISFSSCLKDDSKKYTAEDEIAQREAYLEGLRDKGSNVQKTEKGVYYIVIDEGEGDFAKSGDTLSITYSGYFIDGRLFDTSLDNPNFPDGKMEFVLEDDDSRMIPGFEDGMKVMNKEAKVQLVIPSELAYGSQWSYIIPPYQTLIFVIKLHEIKPS